MGESLNEMDSNLEGDEGGSDDSRLPLSILLSFLFIPLFLSSVFYGLILFALCANHQLIYTCSRPFSLYLFLLFSTFPCRYFLKKVDFYACRIRTAEELLGLRKAFAFPPLASRRAAVASLFPRSVSWAATGHPIAARCRTVSHPFPTANGTRTFNPEQLGIRRVADSLSFTLISGICTMPQRHRLHLPK